MDKSKLEALKHIMSGKPTVKATVVASSPKGLEKGAETIEELAKKLKKKKNGKWSDDEILEHMKAIINRP